MDVKSDGVTISIDPRMQSDEWLIGTAKEIAEAATARSLELPAAIGGLAVEDATDRSEAPTRYYIAKEIIEHQLPASLQACQTITEILNAQRPDKNKVVSPTETALESRLVSWLTDEKLDYIVSVIEGNPGLHFTLVATPNVLASPKEIVMLAKAFNQDRHLYGASVSEDLCDQYTAEQLSATEPNNETPVIFSMIPNKFDESLHCTIVIQRERMAKLQSKNPYLKVPSVLEAVTYWYTLRAQGKELAGSKASDLTCIRHFDLPVLSLHYDRSCILVSRIDPEGQPYLRGSLSSGYNRARIAVG